MAYSEELDARIVNLADGMNLTRKKMFGGTGYLMNGNMVCGVWKDQLILRLDGGSAEEALMLDGADMFAPAGRPMKGWVMVPEATLDERGLELWVDRARTFVTTLPAK